MAIITDIGKVLCCCRYTQPICMKDLLQRFDTVLTPPSLFKSATTRSIQLGTIDAAAAKKK